MTSRRDYADAPAWRGGYVRYDLVREFVIALLAVAALTVLLTVLFSSPDEPPATIAAWSRSDPIDFTTTAVGELDGSSATANYGPPYNHASGSVQHFLLLHPQRWLGVSHNVDTARDFVINPLRSIPSDPALQAALATYQSASPKQQTAWTSAYTGALGKAKANGGSLTLPAGSYGPVAPMMGSLLSMAQSGGLDGALLTSPRRFYETNYTRALLFMNDGGYLASLAQDNHLLGKQWGMMNETGSYPGQTWLWLYTFWYQINPFKSSPNADLQIWLIMAVLTLALICIPFIPGVRSIPRWIPIYKLIWRRHYAGLAASPPAGATGGDRSAASPARTHK